MLEFFTRKAEEFTLSTAEAPKQPLQRVKEPILRYTNAVSDWQSDGAVFLWLAGERPAAVACLSLRKGGGIMREFTTLSDQALRCEREGRLVWAPDAGNALRKPLPDGPKPAATAALRLAQMRRQAERFSGDDWLTPSGRWDTLRVMPQPLYRYAPEKGAVEGAVFALAQGNDPEILLMLEVTRPSGNVPAAWNFAVARMSSRKSRLRLDGKEAWTADSYWNNPRSREDPYLEQPDGKYPDALGAKPAPERD